MYSKFINNQQQLSQNQSSTIINNIASEPPVDAAPIIRQAGILALDATQNSFTTQTNTFNFIAQKLQSQQIQQINLPNFELNLPPLGTNDSAVSIIKWNNNPYLNYSNQTLSTTVVSISLSNLSGSELTVQNLATPIQLSWTINTTNLLSYNSICLYWNTTFKDWDTYGCTPIYTNSTYIICNCTHLTDFAARITAVYSTNIAIMKSASTVYSSSGLQTYTHFYIIFGSIAAFALLMLIAGVYLDIKDSDAYFLTLYEDPIVSSLHTKGYIIDIYRKHNPVTSLEPQTSDIQIPPTLTTLIFNRILFQHTQLGAFLRFDPRLSRLFRILLIFVGLFNSLFITGFMYSYTYGLTSVTTMSLYDSFLLSLITATLNYPSLIILSYFINLAGLHEFRWRYPILLEELERRHNFEKMLVGLDTDEIFPAEKYKGLHIKQIEKNKQKTNLMKLISDYVDAVISIFDRSRKQVYPTPSLEKAYLYALQTYTKVTPKPTIYRYLPFHTVAGASVFIVCIGWFAWCLNYLLLFSAYHTNDVSDAILSAFALNELETIIFIQPLTLVCFVFIGLLARKAYNYIFKKTPNEPIPALYASADPFSTHYSTTFSTQFAYDIFINIPSKVSHATVKNIRSRNLSYASIGSVIDYIETGNKPYKPTEKETKITELYNSILFIRVD